MDIQKQTDRTSDAATRVPTRVLVVDDDPFLRDLLYRYLTRQGYEVAVAETGAEAMACLKENPFHVALIDIVLVEMTGIELVDQITPQYPEMILIMMTGHPSLETVLQALKKGVQDYLIKPFKLDQLDEVLKKCIREKRVMRENHRLQEELETTQAKLKEYENLIQHANFHPSRPQVEHSVVSTNRGGAAYRTQSQQSKEAAIQDRVHTLSVMKDEGIITNDEFEEKRNQLISMNGSRHGEEAS